MQLRIGHQPYWPGSLKRARNTTRPLNTHASDTLNSFIPHKQINLTKISSPKFKQWNRNNVPKCRTRYIRDGFYYSFIKNYTIDLYKNLHVTLQAEWTYSLKWSGVAGGPAPVLSGGPLRGNYTFLQFHFHWLSEHAIDGMKYPLEVHMVHIKTGLTLDEALARADGLAVIGVFFMMHRGYGSDRALEEIIPMMPYIVNSSQNNTEPRRIDITRLLSSEPQSYYTYHGSLTTPLCQEVVTWIVMDKPIYISPDQYALFTKVDVGGDYNYRSLQPRNNRVVYRSIASCASILAPTLPGTLISLFSCLSTSLAAGVNKGVGTFLNIKRKIFGAPAKNCVKAK
ncbi:hypothetical protein SFRURICE_013174 [Spodoptera frugiperda]|nr:hypothetical protein SFRURICE_013174 [Spodoptera frugiperda]